MTFTPESMRCRLEDSFEGLQLTIPGPRSLFLALFLGVWLCGWAAGEYFAATTLLKQGLKDGGNYFLVFWLTFWTIGGLGAGSSFLYNFAGSEVVEFRSADIRISSAWFGMKLFSKTYNLLECKDLDVVGDILSNPALQKRLEGLSKSLGFRAELLRQAPALRTRSSQKMGSVVFTCADKPVLFGRGVDPEEAKYLVEAITGRIPSLRKPPANNVF